MTKRAVVLSVLILTASCSKAPPSLSPVGAMTWQANQGAVAIGTVQRAAIDLNAIQVCQPAPCHPLLSDRNTGIVVDAVAVALPIMRATPAGWKAVASAALASMTKQLDAAGKSTLAAYLTAARTVLDGL